MDDEREEIDAEEAAMEIGFKSPFSETVRDNLPPMNGDGFHLRGFKLEDAEPFADMMYCDPTAGKYFPKPKHDRAEFIRSYSPDDMDGYAVEVLPEHAFAGQVSIRNPDKLLKQCELRIMIATKYRGEHQHFGRKAAALLISHAFEKMNFKSILAVIHPDNQDALKLVGLLGFKFCGKKEGDPKHWQYGFLKYELCSRVSPEKEE